MAAYLVSALLLLIWLCLHAHVYGKQLQVLKKNSLHNDSNVTTMQKELAFRGQSLTKRYLNQELSMEPDFREQYPLNYKPHYKESQITHHWALYQSRWGEYYGTKATINVWSLQNIKSSEQSAAAIWVKNVGDGKPESRNTIQAGWHVRPELYNDNATHFYIYWTADGYQKTGCHNLDCPGFVHTNHSLLVPGIRLEPTSIFDGEQYYITLKIYKDPQTGDWLLFEGKGDARNFVGYWPKSLFTNLADSASRIDWGGSIGFIQPGTSPPMGSGHFPNEKEHRAASFKNIKYVNKKGDLESLYGSESKYEDKEDCYQVSPLFDKGKLDSPDGWTFYFGGPGGCNN